jgi:flagellar basal body-associated protein FliL
MYQDIYLKKNTVDRNIHLAFILIFCLSSIGFFSPVFINSSFFLYFYYFLFCLSTLIIIFNYKKSYYNTFSIPVFLILIASSLASVNAMYSWNQSTYDSIRGVLPIMSYILFFLLSTLKINKEDTEKVIIILGLFFIIIFLFSFFIYPKVLFGGAGQHDETRGFQRVRTDGIGYLFLLSFYSLSEFLIKKRSVFFLIYFLSMVCIVMSLTRTYISFSILFSILFILKKSNFITILLVILIVIAAFYTITQMDFYKILVAQTASETSDIKENIRMQAVDYYMNDFSPNLLSQILGNGQAAGNNSYSKFIQFLELQKGLYTSDIGYIGLYIKLGVLSILAYLIFIIKTIKTSAKEDFLYCKYFLLFIFTISIIIDSTFNTSFIGSIMLAYYLLSIQNKYKVEMDEI